MTTKKIPKFRTLAEEARFWDTHDVADYLSEMKFVDIEFLPRQKREEKVTIRIEPTLKERLEKLARSHGVNLSTLARMWFIEKLRESD